MLHIFAFFSRIKFQIFPGSKRMLIRICQSASLTRIRAENSPLNIPIIEWLLVRQYVLLVLFPLYFHSFILANVHIISPEIQIGCQIGRI